VLSGSSVESSTTTTSSPRRHLLVAGATGSGKGGVVWSLLAGIGPAIRDGLVQVWVIDPKGGMEFASGHALFSRFAYDTGEATSHCCAMRPLSSRREPNGFAVSRGSTCPLLLSP